ncbi:MAG: hypothetical protein M3371_13165 [Acidobacteriota bacterium]|nr:hypothetical protein [Acidobacteriota bacterium]
MLIRKFSFVLFLPLAALVVCSVAQAQSSDRNRRTNETQPTPPTVSLATDVNTLTLCPRDATLATTQVRLKADAKSPDGNPLRYTWTVSGGRIVGDGANPVWDLSGVAPGVYTARVDVATSPDPDCMAFATTAVRINECPPLREFCPNISINFQDVAAAGNLVTFTANVTGGTPGIAPRYDWTVSAGRIVNGLETTSITVDTAGLGGQDIKATLEVGGYGRICSASGMTQIPANIRPKQFDLLGDITRNDEKARLDNFAIQLQNEPEAKGYVIIYGSGRARRGNSPQERATRVRGYLVNTRGIDSSRIVTITGSPQGALQIELWVVPVGAEPPTVRQ